MRKGGDFFGGCGGQITLALEDYSEAMGKSDLTKT